MLKHFLYKHLPQFIFKTCMKIAYVSLYVLSYMYVLLPFDKNGKQSYFEKSNVPTRTTSIKLLRTHITTKFFQLTIILIRQYMANIIQNSLWCFA